jgi:hypothetical protein
MDIGDRVVLLVSIEWTLLEPGHAGTIVGYASPSDSDEFDYLVRFDDVVDVSYDVLVKFSEIIDEGLASS